MSEVSRLPVDEKAQLQERLAKAKAARLEVERRREDAAELEALKAEVEREERGVVDRQAYERLEQEYGAKKIAIVDTDQGWVILKRPTNMLYKRFRDQGAEAKTADLERLVNPCVVHPDRAKFDAMVEETPALLDRAANAVVTLAGFRAKEVSKK